MTQHHNEFGQPVGFPVSNFRPAELPPRTPMSGRVCRVEPIDPDRHAADLFAANRAAPDGRYWTYLPYGPFETLEDYRVWMDKACLGDDPLFHAIIDQATGKAVGVASYLRIDPKVASIEVGHINYAPPMQRSLIATECMYLMMARVFDELGYRRYEWKCNAANEASKRAAVRLGFTYEGTFRQMSVVKGRNRDTAWFSILDREWPAVKQAFQAWLSPDNFAADGNQKQRLSDLTAAALRA
ncbi:GNAT family N-acetyltransferase [Pacificispira sp.]|uniref:GNAT family N-acetyltransferase n=1 Tax=Pacificispira sp. TaxID=2888761 RepID=UPI003BA9B94D